jgi:hypothetical protein
MGVLVSSLFLRAQILRAQYYSKRRQQNAITATTLKQTRLKKQ